MTITAHSGLICCSHWGHLQLSEAVRMCWSSKSGPHPWLWNLRVFFTSEGRKQVGHLQLRDKERVEREGEAVDLPSLMELWVMTKRMYLKTQVAEMSFLWWVKAIEYGCYSSTSKVVPHLEAAGCLLGLYSYFSRHSHHILGNNTIQQSVINVDVVFLFSESPLAWSHTASDKGRVIWARFGLLLITL